MNEKIKLICLAGIIFMLLSTAACKKESYNPAGRWEINFENYYEEKASMTLVFTGTDTRGEIKAENSWATGEYTVSDDVIVFDIESNLCGGQSFRFWGKFNSHETMSGSVRITIPCPDSDITEKSWTAFRK